MRTTYALFLIASCSFSFVSRVEPDFEAQEIDPGISIGYGLAIGDVDGDRKPDILLADKKQFVWYRNGDWKRFVIAENLTEQDNVCIAARDLDGDGKVEVAVGAQWNPGETSDSTKSGAVFYLVRPRDVHQKWTAVRLHAEPTVHRMHWVKISKDRFQLVMLPLHGKGNKNGEGEGVRMIAYDFPPDPSKPWWPYRVVDRTLHLTHNFHVVPNGDRELLYVASKEGVQAYSFNDDAWNPLSENGLTIGGISCGEVRLTGNGPILATVSPMHGTTLIARVAKAPGKGFKPGQHENIVLTTSLNQGHALAVGDLLGDGTEQVVVGWREPDAQGATGIKMFREDDPKKDIWKDYWIDRNGMACEDLKFADLDGDGKDDIIAAGRSTHNLKVYWNKSGKKEKSKRK